MNTLDESNWKGFVADICGPVSPRPLKLLKRMYFEGLGPLLSLLESFQRKFRRRLNAWSYRVCLHRTPALSPAILP